MPDRLAPTLAESLAAAQTWWREAGVDYAYADEPVGWLADAPPAETVAEVRAPPPPPAQAGPEPVGGDRAGWPEDLAAFERWWLSEPSLDAGGTHPRVAPRGAADAELLMLVPMPEDSDRDALLAGRQGRLLASFARAAGLAPGTVALAAALPRHTPLPDWDRIAAHGQGEVLLHLLGLMRPQRLIVFGRSILPLLGHAPAQAAPAVSELAIQGRPVPLLSTYAPERLLENARLRAGLWQRWLEWTDDGRA
jgi:uracil-DNA glycosylase